MRTVSFLLVPALSLLLVGCDPETPRATAADPAVAVPAAVDRAAEERAIRTLGKRHAEAVASKDTAHVGDIYADDVLYLPHDDSVEEGVAAARSAWVRGLMVPGLVLQYTPLAIEVGEGGGMAYERGTVESTMKGKSLEPGNYLYVWRKRDAQWRVVVWMWNVQPSLGRR